MKKLKLNQMENLEGGTSQRNCGILGLGIVISPMLGPIGWGACAGFIATAANSNCF